MLSEEGQLMTKDHKKQLEKCRTALVQNMNPKEVINELRGHQVLTVREAKEISLAGVSDAQNEQLLDCLIRKPDTAFEIFRGALRATEQDSLANLLPS